MAAAGDSPRDREPEAAAVAVPDVEAGDMVNAAKADIYAISPGGPVDPLSDDYAGIVVNYFSVGMMMGGASSVLYPLLVVRGGAPSAFVAASGAVVTACWSYKVAFGMLSDSAPICGYRRKPYLVLGWLWCAGVLASAVVNADPRRLVLTMALAMFGTVWADAAADGFMVQVAHREPLETRGTIQSLAYATVNLGHILVSLLALFGFSGPATNCAGYEPDPAVPCSTDAGMTARVDPGLYQGDPRGWCHAMCPEATFGWDLSVSAFALCVCLVITASLPFYLRLKEEKVKPGPRIGYLRKFRSQIQRRACWQIILYGMISHITFGVHNAAKMPANYLWLGLHTYQHQIMIIFEKCIFFVGLSLVRKHALNVSWRKMVLIGSCLVLLFNSMYFLIIFDVWRNVWFYIFTDVSALFMFTMNFFASHACMVEVAEPGWEALSYNMITTATHSVSPLSAVISYQLLAFFPALNDQSSIAADTPQVRKEFACLHSLVILLNLSSLLSLPLLPRQKKETRELVAKGERSSFWGNYVIGSVFTFLCYSTIVAVVTVSYYDDNGCMKILGGGGCTAEESSIMVIGLVSVVLLYCYGTNFYLSYLPIFKGKQTFSWRMFV